MKAIKVTSRALVLLAFIQVSASAQAVADIIKLNPELVVAAECNGIVFAVAMANFDTGILSEERARIVLRSSSIAFLLTSFKIGQFDNAKQFAQDYDTIFTETYDATYTLIANGTFDWDHQAEADVCSARILDPLTSVPVDRLNAAGIDYFDISEKIKEDNDMRFDYILQLMNARE